MLKAMRAKVKSKEEIYKWFLKNDGGLNNNDCLKSQLSHMVFSPDMSSLCDTEISVEAFAHGYQSSGHVWLPEWLTILRNEPELNLIPGDNKRAFSIYFGDRLIGNLTRDGACYFMYTESLRSNYMDFLESSQLIDTELMEISGIKYGLSREGCLYSMFQCGTERSFIYDFKNSQAMECSSPHIRRWPNSLRPILY